MSVEARGLAPAMLSRRRRAGRRPCTRLLLPRCAGRCGRAGPWVEQRCRWCQVIY
ncbi:MAG: hypothetical protein WKG07_21675 [Hymenobacter sp.]